MRELKPCPFCGKTERIRWTSEESYRKSMEIGGPTGVRMLCEACDIIMYDFCKTKSYELAMDHIAEKWDRRTTHE